MDESSRDDQLNEMQRTIDDLRQLVKDQDDDIRFLLNVIRQQYKERDDAGKRD